MRYPVVIHKDVETDYGVTVPDLPGCFSAGSSIDEALAQVTEAIETHIEGLMMDREPVPLPKRIEDHQADPSFSEGVWALVTVDISKLSGKSRRVNITLPERVLASMDEFAAQRGETRSGLIAQATMEFIAAHRFAEEPSQR